MSTIIVHKSDIRNQTQYFFELRFLLMDGNVKNKMYVWIPRTALKAECNPGTTGVVWSIDVDVFFEAFGKLELQTLPETFSIHTSCSVVSVTQNHKGE